MIQNFRILLLYLVQIHAVTFKKKKSKFDEMYYKIKYQNSMFVLISAPVFNVVWVVRPFHFGVLLVCEDEKMSRKRCCII